MTRITLARIGKNKTVCYAVEELVRCLKVIDVELMIDVRLYDAFDSAVENVIWVGVDKALAPLVPPVRDAYFDDAIHVDITHGVGVITGANERSVLIAAYRLLREMGAAWVRPTDDGEILPHYTVVSIDAHVSEAAAYRNRAICIEGCDCYENVLGTIKWIPRAGMSGYYFQFEKPLTFFEKWYNHVCNDLYPNEHVSKDDILHMVASLEEEIAKRGLLLHYYGHGFTSGPLGLTADGWGLMDDSDIPEDRRHLIAMNKDGVRTLHNRMPLCTNLCYSNPEARSLMTDTAVAYCESHPHVDYLHFWLSDGADNICQCPSCTEHVSDYYVMMLNELDEKMTAKGLHQKVVFLLYHDTLWAPLKERFRDSDRFVLMFAPSGRDFRTSFAGLDLSLERALPPMKTDGKTTRVVAVEDNLALLRAWQKVYGGESFDYDYHMCFARNRDFGFFDLSRVMFEDMKTLADIGIDGMVSCQMSRCSFPTNLPSQMMADALWDRTADFEKQSSRYFREAYGEDGEAVKEFFRTVSAHLELKEGLSVEEKRTAYRELKCAVYEFDRLLSRNHGARGKLPFAVWKSWDYLVYYREMLLYYLDALIAGCEGKEEERTEICRAAVRYLKHHEMDVYKTLEFWTYSSLLSRECGFKDPILKTEDQLQL